MTAETPARRDPFNLFLTVACVALAVLVVLLAIQNRSLKSQLAAKADALPPDAIKVGDALPGFPVADAAGVGSRIEFEGGERTLLLVFSSTCHACQDTIPKWNSILGEGVPVGVRVVGIQTDLSTAGAVPALVSSFPVYAPSEDRGAIMKKFPFVPVAAMVDPRGHVSGVWIGVPNDDQVAELRKAIAG